MNINIAVMAGGESRRFDGDKTLEIFDGKPMIQHPVDNLSEISDGIIVVAKDCSKYSFLEIDCIADAYDVQCPMVGILTALKHFQTPIFAVAADTPFADPAHVRKLFTALDGYDAVMPVIDGKQHPLYSCYNTSLITALDRAVDSGQYGLMKVLAELNVLYLDNNSLFHSENEKKSFININTREDYNRAKKYTGVSDG